MAALPDSLTSREASATRRALIAAIDAQSSGQVARIDAASLSRFDSSALAVLLELRRHALASGRPFELVGVPDRLRGLAALYGVEALLSSDGGGAAADGVA